MNFAVLWPQVRWRGDLRGSATSLSRLQSSCGLRLALEPTAMSSQARRPFTLSKTPCPNLWPWARATRGGGTVLSEALPGSHTGRSPPGECLRGLWAISLVPPELPKASVTLTRGKSPPLAELLGSSSSLPWLPGIRTWEASGREQGTSRLTPAWTGLPHGHPTTLPVLLTGPYPYPCPCPAQGGGLVQAARSWPPGVR